MTEPSLALQTAIRARLLATPEVTALVAPTAIRDGDTRPNAFPSIILGAGQARVDGHYGSYRNTTVFMDLHIWGDTLEAAKIVGAATSRALFPALDVPCFDLTDGLSTERSIYMHDSAGYGHGIVSVRALMGGAV